jgi:hypothetical protein
MQFFDLNSLSNMMKTNFETLTATNQMATEHAQSLIRKGTDYVQHNIATTLESMRDTMSSTDFEQVMTNQRKYAKTTIEHSVHHAKELMDIASKSTLKAFDIGTKPEHNKKTHNHETKNEVKK